MLDFLMVSVRSTKRGTIEIYPKFVIKKSSDLMIRGGDFYAIWNDELKLWSTDEQDALQLIDKELLKYKEENKKKNEKFENATQKILDNKNNNKIKNVVKKEDKRRVSGTSLKDLLNSPTFKDMYKNTREDNDEGR